ncbi:MAG: GntR family transcriptional regulator [Lentisphaeria bacterium]|nr:GntR family transcriptional regulator [Lentisphaeria bacterium]
MRKAGIPIYRTITDDLIKAIESGKLKPGDRIASIRELSAQYDVSQITVLRVFKELAAAGKVSRRDGMGYYVRGEDGDDAESQGRTLILACRSPREVSNDDNFILRLTEGIHTRALEEGFSLFIPRTVATIRGPAIDDTHMKNLLRDIRGVPHPAGIILDMLYPDDMIRKHILPHIGSLPCVIAGRRSELPVRTVSLPFEKAAADAAILALKSGAREFFIYEQENNQWGGNSLLCRHFQNLLTAQGIPAKNIFYRGKILQSPKRDRELLDELEKRIASSPDKVFVFSSSDYFSKSIIRELQASCRFGTRASLISFGGFEIIHRLDPAVTCIVPDARQIGVLAVELTLKSEAAASLENRTTDCRIELNATL